MGITADRNNKQVVESVISNFLQDVDNKMLQALSYAGEMCLREARLNKGYMDQTGNLTSSMGYIILKNGALARQSGFDSRAGSNPALGGAKGKDLALQLASRYTGYYTLIVVAGMNYAALVEARGKNVLTSAELLAEKEIPKLLKQLKIRK